MKVDLAGRRRFSQQRNRDENWVCLGRTVESEFKVCMNECMNAVESERKELSECVLNRKDVQKNYSSQDLSRKTRLDGNMYNASEKIDLVIRDHS